MTAELLRAQFGSVAVDADARSLSVEIPGNSVAVHLAEGGTWRIACASADPALHQRIDTCLLRLQTAFERFSATPGTL